MEVWVPWQKETGEYGCNWILAKDLNFAFVIVLFSVNIYNIYHKIRKKSWRLSILENIELVDEFKIFWENKNYHRAFFS